MRDPPVPQTDDLLCCLIHSTGAAFNRLYRKPLQRIGLTYPQYLVMLTLWSADGLSLDEIGQRLRVDDELLALLLVELEGQGFLRRVADPRGSGGTAIALTQRGRALRHHVGEVMGCAREAVGLDDGALTDLVARMRSLRDNLELASSLAHGRSRTPRPDA